MRVLLAICVGTLAITGLPPRSSWAQVAAPLAVTPPAVACQAPCTDEAHAPRATNWRTRLQHPSAWLHLALSQRWHSELLRNHVRNETRGLDAAALWVRTQVSVDAMFGPGTLSLEVMDARGWASAAAFATTQQVNALDVLRAHASVSAKRVLRAEDHLTLRIGRMTLDLGSRRLVARNRFRNTINAFTGADAVWRASAQPAAATAHAFIVMPVTRLPSQTAALDANQWQADRENTNALFTGIWGSRAWPTPDEKHGPLAVGATPAGRATSAKTPALPRIEAYAYGLLERQGREPSLGRKLLTLGVRWFAAKAPATVDYDIEVMGQAGQLRASTAPEAIKLNHNAAAAHLELGYTFATAWAPRAALLYDYASGDRDSADTASQRFDPLFGARRFDLAPTASFGVLTRSNLNSPGLRFEAQQGHLSGWAAARAAWLASASDAWAGTGLRSTEANARYIGEDAEAGVRYELTSLATIIELGGAILHPGPVATQRNTAAEQQQPTWYGYAMLALTL